MFEDIHNRLFGSIGSKIKTLAKLGCYFCLIVGFCVPSGGHFLLPLVMSARHI